MSAPLDQRTPPKPLFRIGRCPHPWAWPDWAYAAPDGTFGNRWDDPGRQYRVLYASNQRLGTFLEILARYRPDPNVVAGLAEIQGDDDALPPGVVPKSLLTTRLMGEADVQGNFADIDSVRSLAYLREVLAPRLVHYGITDLDAATIKSSTPREFTQEVSLHVYELSTKETGERAYEGICYASRLGDDLENWAIFEPTVAESESRLIQIGACTVILEDDSDILRALELFNLTLV